MKVLDNGTYEIKGYKPSYVAGKNKGISLPLKMMGVNEDKLLENVSVSMFPETNSNRKNFL